MRVRKLSAGERADEIVDAVEELIVRDRTLAIGMNQVAEEISTSRALIYVYFDSVPTIIDDVCLRHLQALAARLRGAAHAEVVGERAAALCVAYLDYLAEQGPALQYILRDPERHGPLEKSRPLLRRLIRSVVGEARARLHMEWREAYVLVELLLAVPDTLARQLRDRQIDMVVARETCDRLVSDLVNDLRVLR